jgi:hypothetical protein
MLRRYETYAFLRGAETHERQRLADVLLDAGRYIPEVLGSAVGWNRSSASSELVWEHWFESPTSYQRYMVHPYHADLIDRFVLADSPERVVETVKGAGLFGYRCEGAPPDTSSARLVVLLDLDPEAGDVLHQRLWDGLRDAVSALGADTIGFGANVLANAWFDGVTPLPGPPPRWSHVWEAGLPTAPSTGLDAVLGAVLDRTVVHASRHLSYDVVRSTPQSGAEEGCSLP